MFGSNIGGINVSNKDSDVLFNTCRYKSHLVYIHFYTEQRRGFVPDVARHEYSPKLK